MAVKVTYDADQKLILDGLACDCGSEHQQPDQDIYVGTNLLDRLPDMIAKRGLGKHCVLVADDQTWPLAGDTVRNLLTMADFDVTVCLLRRDGELEPDERACGELLLTMDESTEFLISVGSGSITDTTRVVAVRTGKPFVSVGTAPSMDGYTSVVAPLLLRGVKIHRAAVCPEIIVCDLDLLATAPAHLIAAGVGDVLGKYIAKADWQLGHLINDEPYCPVCAEIVTDAVNKLVQHADSIKNKTQDGMRILIEALLLSGITIMIIGHTRAVASVEHNLVHYWDMAKLSQHKKQPSHGLAVGLSTHFIWRFYTRFASEDVSALDLNRIKKQHQSHEARRAFLLKAYGREAGETIIRENPEDFLSWDEQARRVKRVQARAAEIRQVLNALPPYETICDVLQTLEAPDKPADIAIDEQILNWSLHCGKDYRSRYSLMKTLDECGLLDTYLADYPLPAQSPIRD